MLVRPSGSVDYRARAHRWVYRGLGWSPFWPQGSSILFNEDGPLEAREGRGGRGKQPGGVTRATHAIPDIVAGRNTARIAARRLSPRRSGPPSSWLRLLPLRPRPRGLGDDHSAQDLIPNSDPADVDVAGLSHPILLGARRAGTIRRRIFGTTAIASAAQGAT